MSKLAAAIVVALVSTPLRAAELPQEEPIILGRQERPPKFKITTPEVFLDFLGRYTSDTSSGRDGGESETTQTYLRESLRLVTAGHVLDPGFFNFNVDALFGVSQSQVELDGASDRDNSPVSQYDLTATLLGRSSAPLTVYARRSDELVYRAFAPSLQNIQQTIGADWNIRSKTIPTTFRVYQSTQEQSSVVGEEDFDFEQQAFEWHTEWLISSRQTVIWDYIYSNIAQSNVLTGGDRLTTDDTTQNATLTHNWDLDSRKLSSLRSTLNYYDQSGDFDQNRLRLDERLNLHHSDAFETFYSYAYNQADYPASDYTQHTATAGFRHKLYQSLITNGVLGGNTVTQGGSGGGEDATTNEQFANVNLTYTKVVPLGLLTANLGGAWSGQQNDARSEPLRIIDQGIVLEGTVPAVISRRNVNAASIVLTDRVGRIYRPGLDYSVLAFPDRVEIQRVIGGDIPDSSVSLVDYEIAPEPGHDITTVGLAAGVRYDFKEGPLAGLGLFARYYQQDQTVSPATTLIIADDVSDLTLGVEYRWKGLLLGAERQRHDSTISPYDATRFRGSFSHQARDTSFSLNVSETMIQYDGSYDVDIFTVGGTVRHHFNRDLTGTYTAHWLRQSDAFQEDTRGFEQELNLTWKHRQTEIIGIIRHVNYDTQDQENDFLIFQLSLQRKF